MRLELAVKSLGRRALGPYHVDECQIIHEFLGDGAQRVMLDVGAAFGDSLESFADAGWSIHAFEPDPANRERLTQSHAHRANVTIVPAAISDERGSLTLYTSEESPGISSLSPFTDGHEAAGVVAVTTLGDYLAEHPEVDHVDFLKVDVEGYEDNVLRGYDWRLAPTAVVLEFEDRKTVPLGYSWRDLADGLLSRGYGVIVSEWEADASYGGNHEWQGFHPYPATLNDERAWGNLIAVRERFDDLLALAARVEARYRRRGRFERLRRPRQSVMSAGS